MSTIEESDTARETGGIARRAGVTLLGSVTQGGLGFASEVLIAQWAGPAIFGLYALAYGLVRVAEMAAFFGLRVATLHFLPIDRRAGAPGDAAGTVLAVVVLPTVLAGAIAGALWAGAPWLANVLSESPGAAAVVVRRFAPALPFMVFAWMAGVVTWAFGHSRQHVIVKNVVQPVGFFAALCALAIAGADPVWIGTAFVGAHVASSAGGVFALIRVAGPVLRAARPRFRLLRLVRYGAPDFVTSILFVGLRWTDIALLGMFATAADVGIYRACVLPLLLLEMIPNALNAGAASVLPVLAEEGRTTELARAYGAAVRWTGAASLAVWWVFWVGRTEVLQLLGDEFMAGAAALGILVSAQLLNNVGSTAGFLLSVSGRVRLETLNAAVAVATNVVLNVVLIPRLGLVGAAVATSSSLLLLNAMRIVQVRRSLGVPTLQPGLRRLGWVWICMLVAPFVSGVAAELGGSLAGRMLVLAVVGVPSLYAIWRLGLVEADRDALRRAARRTSGVPGGSSGSAPR